MNPVPLHGPLWFKGRVVKIDPADGMVIGINSGFRFPAAANLDGEGTLWGVGTNFGELSKV